MILHIILKIIKVDDMAKIVKVIDTDGLSLDTISKIERTMIYVSDYFADDGVRFVELYNSQGDIIRIFPERIEEIVIMATTKELLSKALVALYLLEDKLGYDESEEGVIVGEVVNKLQKLLS